MAKKAANLKGIGIAQNRLLYKMIKEDLVIKLMVNDYGREREIVLMDKTADNWYEDVSPKMLESLCKRNLLDCFGWMPCLSATIDTYSVKRSVAAQLGIKETEPSTK